MKTLSRLWNISHQENSRAGGPQGREQSSPFEHIWNALDRLATIVPNRPALASGLWSLRFIDRILFADGTLADSGLLSDVTVEELYRLMEGPSLEEVMVLFYASFCEPCKVMKTTEYQAAIKTFNEDHLKTRVVTIRVDNEKDPLIDAFWDTVGPVPVKVTHVESGKEEIVEESFVPSTLLLHTPSNRYARSMKIPTTPDSLGQLVHKGFRTPQKFMKQFPQRESLSPK